MLSKHRFPATIIFLTVAGEEQGLNGSTHFAKMAKEQGWQLEGALNNDIVGGNRTPGDTEQNNNWVRVFSEGIPAAASEADLRRIRSVGGENDSASRELARYVAAVGDEYDFGQFTPKLIFRRDRYFVAATTAPSMNRASPPSASLNIVKISTISTRPLEQKMASNMETCQSMWTLAMSPMWPV